MPFMEMLCHFTITKENQEFEGATPAGQGVMMAEIIYRVKNYTSLK